MIDVSTTLLARLDFAGLSMPQAEWRFHGVRKWRFDFAWPARKVAIEIEGGVTERWNRRGRHLRAPGYQTDLDKYNAALAMGWHVYRFSARDIQENTPSFRHSLVAIERAVGLKRDAR